MITKEQRFSISCWLGLEFGEKNPDELTDEEIVQELMDAFSELHSDYAKSCERVRRINKAVYTLAYEYGLLEHD